MVFVDIGQGDGCLLVTPKDEHFVIDAGEGDNMFRYLRWRYGGFDKPWKFKGAVISNPDSDHYGGFKDIFEEPNVSFGTLYHNGIVERNGKNSLGPKTTSGLPRFLTYIVRDTNDLRQFLSVPGRWKRKEYPTLLEKGLREKKYDEFKMLSCEDGHLPGYKAGKELVIEVLGPVCENQRLRWFGGIGKTKNGHSVVLRVQYKDVSLLLGGDLNTKAEKFLLEHHTGLKVPSKTVEDQKMLIERARKVFQVDIAKCCHHGSSDFTLDFLFATNPIATVISSGDNEPHSHPRADTLGTIGLCSRGIRPLIFSTELARSSKESIKHPYVLKAQLRDLQKQIDKAPEDTDKERRKKKSLEKRFDKLVDSIDRSVAVFGAIHVRTDGGKVIIAQKLERPRSKKKKWDVYCLEPTHGGQLAFQSRY